jgi:hypothetical protein
MQPDVGYPQAPAPYPAQADPVTQMQPDVGYPQPPAPYPVQPDPITQMQPDVGDIQQNQSEDQTEDAKSVELSNQINDM